MVRMSRQSKQSRWQKISRPAIRSLRSRSLMGGSLTTPISCRQNSWYRRRGRRTMTVRIVTDSTADLQPEEAETLGITIVPLTVFFGEEAYLDNVELDNASFYSKLQTSKELPRTSQPSPASFQAAFTRLIEEGADGIISVHLSSK